MSFSGDFSTVQNAILQGPQYSSSLYPRGFRIPSAPNVQGMHDLGIRKMAQHEEYRKQVRADMRALRMLDRGIFRDDRPDAEAEIMDEFEDIGLRTEFDIASSWIAGLNRRVVKHCNRPGYEESARQVQLFAQFIYESSKDSFADRPDMDMNVALVREFMAKGRGWISWTINPYADEGESPFIKRLIDPTQVVWDLSPGGNSIARVWRIYSATFDQLVGTYGTPGNQEWGKLKSITGALDSGSDIPIPQVVEYWDPWYRFVSIGGVPLLDVVAHKYGEVPYTMLYSPMGESMGMEMPADGDMNGWDAGEMFRRGLGYKTPSFVTYLKRQHFQMEAVMSRELYLSKFAMYPDYMVTRSQLASGKPKKGIARQPGAVHTHSDEEVWETVEVSPTASQALDVVVQGVASSLDRAKAPAAATGIQNDSQATATAQRGQAQQGQMIWKTWASAIDSGEGRGLSKCVRIWRRVGSSALMAGGGSGRMFVSNFQPKKNEPGAFELNPNAIAEAGDRVTMISDSQDPESWLLKAQTGKLMNEQGFTRQFTASRLFSVEYDEEMAADWFEEQALQQAMQHPKFAEIIGVPLMLRKNMADMQGNPQAQVMLMQMLEGWTATVGRLGALEVQAKQVELETQLIQLEQQRMQLQQMQQMAAMGGPMMGQAMTMPPGGGAPIPMGAGSGPPAGPNGGGLPGQGGRPGESSGAPTAGQDFSQQAKGPGSGSQASEGAAAQTGGAG